MKSAEQWLHEYSSSHQNISNQRFHFICVPAIVWSVIAALWTIPVPEHLLRPGAVAALMVAAALAFYFRLSKSLGLGLTLLFGLALLSCWWLSNTLGTMNLLWIAIAVFVVAWIGQFIGHHLEGSRPSFFTDVVYLLIGPMWTLSKLYRKLGIAV